MKPRFNSLRNSLALAFAIGFTVTSASATSYYFDGGIVDINTNGNGAAGGVNGNWNTTVKNWDQGATAHFVWNNVTNAADTAVFGGANTKIVTVSGTVTAGTVQMVNSGWTFTGGTIDTDNFDSNGFTATTLTSNITGTINFKATGWTGDLGTTTAVVVNADNTGLTSTTVNLNADANHMVLNNAGALGADGADVQITKGVVNLGNTAATAISYNKWDMDLNGGAIRARFGIQTINGPVTVSANSWLLTRAANDAGQDAKLVFSSTATIDLGANTLSLHSAANPDNSGIELNGVISGTGNLTQAVSTLTNAGTAAGLITLGAANTFSGTATLTANQGAFALNNVNALQNATLNTGLSGTQSVTFVVSGSNTYNIGALTGADALDIGGNSLSVGSKAGTTTYSGAIGVTSAAGGLTKVGSGSTLQLTGTSIYTGGTQIDAGTLTLGHATDTLANGGAVNVNGGELALGTNTDTVGAVTLTSGSITGTGAGKLTASSYDVRSGSISAKLGGSGVGLTKTTGGTVTITSDNSSGGYTGATNVSAGKLVIDGNISTSTLTTVSGTGTLGGSGTVGALAVLNGGTLAPGNSPGTLTVGGTLSLENLSILSFELNPSDMTVGGGINDLITGVTNLTLDGLLNVTGTGSFAGVTSGIWRLFNYTGSLTDNAVTLNTMPTLDSGYSWSLDTATANQVNLTIVPEPNVAALIGGLGVLALLRRRRA